MTEVIAIIHEKFYWTNQHKIKGPLNYNFSIDEWLVYAPFNEDFGPLNIS